jgi:hypothetical protein
MSEISGKQVPPILLGWREWVLLPELCATALRAKIDTGARTSSLHVERQWRFTEQGEPWVGFEIRPRRTKQRIIQAALPLLEDRMVSDSGGHRTLRPFVLTSVQVGGQVRRVEMNLADRRGMLFPLLLGRSALVGFHMDPDASFLHTRPQKPL